MTWTTGALLYALVMVLGYGGCLVALSIQYHKHALGLRNEVYSEEMKQYTILGALFAILWPLTLLGLLFYGIGTVGHRGVGYLVRRWTRGARTAEVLRKAGR